MTNPDELAILYADDDPDDRLLAEVAHAESGTNHPLIFVHDGGEALEYLRRTGRYASRPMEPMTGLVLLDLNMPGTGGLAALGMIRADPAIGLMPVVIMTTSSARVDIFASYAAGANSYIVKPSSFPSLVQVFECLSHYWFRLSSLALETSR